MEKSQSLFISPITLCEKVTVTFHIIHHFMFKSPSHFSYHLSFYVVKSQSLFISSVTLCEQVTITFYISHHFMFKSTCHISLHLSHCCGKVPVPFHIICHNMWKSHQSFFCIISHCMRKSPSPFSYHMSLYVETKMEFLAVGKTCNATFSPPKFFKERMFSNTVSLISVSMIPHNWC